MRILVWQWGRFGAGARYALEMARALTNCCQHETLLSLSEGAELLRDPQMRGAVDLPIRTYASAREFVQRTAGIGGILKPVVERLRARRPDVAVVTMMGYWDIFLARHLRRLGVPIVVIVHDAEVHPGDRFHLAVRLQRYLAENSAGVITLTDHVGGQIKGMIQTEGKVFATIPLGVFDFADLDLPPPNLPQAVPGRPFRLLLAGRLKRYKGLELLTEALRRLSDITIELRVAGTAHEAQAVEALAKLPGVSLDLGWKSDREILAHLDWSDACVLPYIEASQSGLVPQALMRGRPIIATPVGGLPEQVEHERTGLITESVTPDTLAAAIRRLATDRGLLRGFAENAMRQAENELRWHTLAPRYSAVFEEAARARPRKARNS